ncbi:ubiquitin thioesterase ZRANB1-like [Clytia hemisphaerica]|uniref:ubiquitinyl hydrolase 1 n=1 Tax=Clytia hemisphaerica TaxID=252671 RepID=A0A7M5XGJ7_9CNID
MPKNEAEFKWTCKQCTYGNWPSATKCVMCKFDPRNSINKNHIAEGGNHENSERCHVIDCLGESTCEHQGSGDETSSSNEKNGEACSSLNKINKWPCSLCSYTNWTKSEFCVMCKTEKPSEFKLVESLRNIEKNEEKKEKNKFSSLTRGHKWLCVKCTYENWPKAFKCAICQHPKNKSYKQDDGQKNEKTCLNEKKTLKEKNSSYSRKIHSPKRSPPRSPNTISRNNSINNIFDISKQDDDKIMDIALSMEKITFPSENKRLNQIRNRMQPKDWVWLAACKGVADHDITAVSNYLALGGDRARQLSNEDVTVLNQPGRFEQGHTLVHLAIRFQREDILRMLLLPETPHRSRKRLPCHECPELATTIRKNVAHSIRSRKGEFGCPFFTELVTFSLPGDMLELPNSTRHQIFSEILDVDVKNVLEAESAINWSSELTNQYGSCLYPLWNRAAGDCLLDSVLQATWGVFDRDNVLRKKLHESLYEGYNKFYPRWKEAEQMQASEMNYTLDDQQWKNDWTSLVSLAATAGNSLEQAHVFALAHILRRPIIIYAVKYVKGFKGESIDLARFEGVYLPMLWDEDFTWKNPIALGYTRGHFSALVPMERPNYANYAGAGAHVEWNEDDAHVTYLPMVDHEGHLMPVHFLTLDEVGQEEKLLQKYFDCCITDGGILAAKQVITPRPHLVNQMIDEWINRYKTKQHIETFDMRGAAKQ